MHGGKNPGAPLGNMNAYLDGRYTAQAIAERRKAAALHEAATALLFEAIRARTDVARKLFRGALLPQEAEKQHQAIRAQIAAALAMRGKAIALKDRWIDRYRGRRED